MLEKVIEGKVCSYAQAKGLLVYKFTSIARAGVPDRLFILPDGTMFFIEFKHKGKKPTPAQGREHTRLRGHKVLVFVIDNVEDGKTLIDTLGKDDA
jgi:hypothetical protein